MGSNEQRIAIHKASIMKNIYETVNGEIVQKGETINIAEFQERLGKGEKFLTPSDIERFQADVKSRIIKAYAPKDKEAILKKGEKEISLLKSVTVENEIGRKFQFFSTGVEKTEE